MRALHVKLWHVFHEKIGVCQNVNMPQLEDMDSNSSTDSIAEVTLHIPKLPMKDVVAMRNDSSGVCKGPMENIRSTSHTLIGVCDLTHAVVVVTKLK